MVSCPAYRVGEASTSPQGLPYRWIVKAVIPASFLLLFLAALARLIQEVQLLRHGGSLSARTLPANVSGLRGLFTVQARDPAGHGLGE